MEEARKEIEKKMEKIRHKIVVISGKGGVGKTTTLHLLLGDTPPTQYVPTIALNLETVENIRFGNYSLVLWDFAGQERFRNLWRFYFHGADVIFLVCDSTLRNVLISKDILRLIKRDAPKVPVFVLANKQDLPNAMKPEVIQKILGIPTFPMVAIDKERRNEMLRILMNAAAHYVGVALPDLPPSELLKFSTEAAERAAATSSLRSTRGQTIEEGEELEEGPEESDEEDFGDIEVEDLETIEIVEEVLVDEDGHIIDDISDEYEIIEEVVEEVIVEEPNEEVAEAGEQEVELTQSQPEEAAPVENGSRDLAKAIISERLDADEMIEEELDRAPDETLQSALEALSSDEVPADADELPPPSMEEKEREELTKILGLLDDRSQAREDEEPDASPATVNEDAVKELSRVLEPEASDESEEEESDDGEAEEESSTDTGSADAACDDEGEANVESSDD